MLTSKGWCCVVTKEEQDGPIYAFEEEYALLSAQMRNLHISRISEMPRIELYLDQVLSIVSGELGFMYTPDEKIVTGAMVNNYVKQRIVPAPTRKRYTRRHLASLLFVCAFKRVLSISQIGELFSLAVRLDVDVERAYDAIVSLFEYAISDLFPSDPNASPKHQAEGFVLVDSQGNRLSGELERLLENAVILLAYTVYVDRMLALETRVAFGEE